MPADSTGKMNRTAINDCLLKARYHGIELNRARFTEFCKLGADGVTIVEALRIAKENNTQIDPLHLCGLSLIGDDPVKFIQDHIQVHTHTFNHFIGCNNEHIAGYCKDQAYAQASCTVSFRLPLHHKGNISHLHFLQERLAARLAIQIFTAASFEQLQQEQPKHEHDLFILGKKILSTLMTVEISFTETTADSKKDSSQ